MFYSCFFFVSLDKRLKPGKAVDSLEKKRLKRKLSKSKLRQKRKAEKQQQSADNKISSPSEKKSTAVKKPVFNKEGNVVFSKFEFSDKQSSGDKQKSGVITGKNYKVLLDQVEKQKSKIRKVKETNPDKAKSMEEKLKWKSALSKAEGVKVRDNPELLKKSLKKHEKKKEYSRQKWDDREKNVAQQMKQRQDKRAKNIAKKKEGRKENKIKLAKKRGRVVI